MRLESGSEQETERIGDRLGRLLKVGDVVAMRGGLGAGKTAFVRGFARGAGYSGRVTSPTYTIVNEYLSSPPVFHFDLYRLKGEDDLYDTGWDDYRARGICVAEWSERAEGLFASDCITVDIEVTGEHTRVISIEGVDL